MQISKEEIEARIDSLLAEGEKKYGKAFRNDFIVLLGLVKMLNPEKQTEKSSRIIPLSEWNNYHSYPTKGSLYQFHYERETNGFDYCVEHGGKNGKRILINEDKFWEWHKDRQNKFN